MSGLPRVTLRKRLARAIRDGHPWIYRDALAGAPRLPDGAVVLVTDAAGRPLARGFWDARSPIAVRVLDGAVDEPPATAIRARVRDALARRLALVDRGETDAFRWIHGEADRLPGIHVDLYGAAATVRYDGGGARAFYEGLPERLREAAAGWAHDRTVVERRRRSAGADEAAAVLGHAPRRRCRGAGKRPPLRRRSAARAEGRPVPRPARQPRAGPDARVRPARAQPVRLHGGVFDLRRRGRRARDGDRRPGGARDRRRPAQLRAQPAAAGGARFVAGDAFAFLETAAARRRALRPGHLRPAELRAQPPRAPDRPPRLPAAPRLCRGGHRAGRDRCARRRARATSTARPFWPPIRDGVGEARRASCCKSSEAPPPITPSSPSSPRAIT